MSTLFSKQEQSRRERLAPLAERMRPRALDEIVGQDGLVATGAPLRFLIESGHIPSMILWGPPGTGKTTLAKLFAQTAGALFESLSAVTAGVADVRLIVKAAQERLEQRGQRTILFLDEIHRFNKAQQDGFLPFVENGTIILIGATTENPSFEVNAALLSRCRVFVLKRLEEPSFRRILDLALLDVERGYGLEQIEVADDVVKAIIRNADGDGRHALHLLEMLVQATVPIEKDGKMVKKLEIDQLATLVQRNQHLYDKNGEEHYNLISALHKSLRGSDTDAALYWLVRMLESGEEPLYVARRLVRFASEDIGLADPQALVQALSGYQAAHDLGWPECNVHLAQVVAYLARAPKSNALYVAYGRAREDVKDLPNEPVPLHLRNAPTALMKDLEYGKGYKYNPDVEGMIEQDYLPEKLKGRKYL